jgi:hypothetical protein
MRNKGLNYDLKATYPNVKFLTSTTDRKALKAFCYEIRFWYEKSAHSNTQVVLDNLFRATKRSIHRQMTPYFSRDKFIAIKDTPKDLEGSAENVFGIFEFTLFPEMKLENKMEVIQIFNSITQNVYEDVFEGRQDIKKTKNG